MIHSFRLRLALFSALLCGIALCVFGWASYWFVQDLRIEKLAREVRENAEREVRRVRTADDWRRMEGKIAASLGLTRGTDLVLLVEDAGGGAIYRSPHWPHGLVADGLPWPRRGSPAPPSPGSAGPMDARAAEDAQPRRPPPSPEPYPPEPPPASASITRQVDGQTWHVGLAASEHARVAIGVFPDFVADEMRSLRNGFALALPLALLLIGCGAWLFSARAIRPVTRLIDATREVSADRLDCRIGSQGEDREFAELIAMFNAMLERLQRSFGQAQRFSADAAHELKTPLAILQGQLEQLIGRAEPGSAMQSELTGILDEVRRLSTISRKLLLLSQADAGRLALHRQPYDLSKTLLDLAEDLHLIGAGLDVSTQVEPGLVLNVDTSLFTQILHNLVSNAVKYNIPRGWVRIAAFARDGRVRVEIANSSPGIARDDRERLFDRFFRADSARGRHVEGSGLGLSVAREIARAHGGDIAAAVADDGTVRFALVMPHPPQARTASAPSSPAH